MKTHHLLTTALLLVAGALTQAQWFSPTNHGPSNIDTSEWHEPQLAISGKWLGPFWPTGWTWKQDNMYSQPGAQPGAGVWILKHPYTQGLFANSLNIMPKAYYKPVPTTGTPGAWVLKPSPSNSTSPPSRASMRGPLWHANRGAHLFGWSNIPNKPVYLWSNASLLVQQAPDLIFTPGSEVPGTTFLAGAPRWNFPANTPYSVGFYNKSNSTHGFVIIPNLVGAGLRDLHVIDKKTMVVIDSWGDAWIIRHTTNLGSSVQSGYSAVKVGTGVSGMPLSTLGGAMLGKVFAVDMAGEVVEINATGNVIYQHGAPTGFAVRSTPVAAYDGALLVLANHPNLSVHDNNGPAKLWKRVYVNGAWQPWTLATQPPGTVNHPTNGFLMPRTLIGLSVDTTRRFVYGTDVTGLTWLCKITQTSTGMTQSAWTNLGRP